MIGDLSMAMWVFHRLTEMHVTYIHQTSHVPDDMPSITLRIETIPHKESTVRDDPYPGWKPPGNYHHRRGRR